MEAARGLQEVGSSQRLAGGIEKARGLHEVLKQLKACRRYRSSQRLAGGIEAAKGLQEV